MSWDTPFEEPIRLPSGKLLTKLRDAGEYIASLPARIHAQPNWQTAMSALIAAADGGPTMFARISLMQVIMPQVGPVDSPKRRTI